MKIQNEIFLKNLVNLGSVEINFSGIPFLIQNYWNNNTENLSISEGHRKF
jgi:hypothetical protein